MAHDLARTLGIQYPIIQAPMGGGATTPELVASVSDAGALGSLAAGYLSGVQIAEAVAAIRRRTQRPFGINLIVPDPTPPSLDGVDEMLELLAPYHRALGIAPPAVPARFAEPFEAQVEAVLAARPAVFSFTFNVPPPAVIRALRLASIYVMGTATTVAEARALVNAEVDAVVAQGSEAGGHRGTFAGPFEAGLVGTLALVPQMVDAVEVPVIAAGGIMDGRGLVAARALGAAGVQLGTAFLTCRESGVPEAYKAAVRAADDDATTLTRAWSGRPLRVVRNQFVEEMGDCPLPPYPVQNALTRPLRAAASARGATAFMGLLAGQASRLARDLSAAELVDRLVAEAEAVARELRQTPCWGIVSTD
jgi:nitronate monooxygenase